jgi:hypothetical protein
MEKGLLPERPRSSLDQNPVVVASSILEDSLTIPSPMKSARGAQQPPIPISVATTAVVASPRRSPRKIFNPLVKPQRVSF